MSVESFLPALGMKEEMAVLASALFAVVSVVANFFGGVLTEKKRAELQLEVGWVGVGGGNNAMGTRSCCVTCLGEWRAFLAPLRLPRARLLACLLPAPLCAAGARPPVPAAAPGDTERYRPLQGAAAGVGWA